MTWNVYFGADLTPLIGIKEKGVSAAVTKILEQLIKTDFPARAKVIAEQIYQTMPDIIGLQEVALWTIQAPGYRYMLDFLYLLKENLRRLCLNYYVVVINRNLRNRLPCNTGEIVGMMDRDVVLARCRSPLMFSGIKQRNFVIKIDTIGNREEDKTPDNIWPSDHAGVVAALEV